VRQRQLRQLIWHSELGWHVGQDTRPDGTGPGRHAREIEPGTAGHKGIVGLPQGAGAETAEILQDAVAQELDGITGKNRVTEWPSSTAAVN
jgi:hypothetical protein